MKYLLPLLLLAVLIYIAWPYVNLLRLDRALMTNDQETLAKLVDIEAVRETRKKNIEQELKRSLGPQGVMPEFMQEGARWMGAAAVDTTITWDWLREKLRWNKNTRPDVYPSIISDLSYAFFESPTRFIVRIGELGSNPLHLRMVFKNWRWRVTEIYD